MNDPRAVSPHPTKPVQIIGVASGQGAPDRGCASGPEVLQNGGLIAQLAQRGMDVQWRTTLQPSSGSELAVVSSLCRTLADQVSTVLQEGARPLILGGDHSCAIGTWKGVMQARGTQQPIGLIWIDAHMDAHTARTSPSGALHGMPLACLLGHGAAELTAIGGGACLDPRHVCLIGVRSFEEGEAVLLNALGVRVFHMEEVARRGLHAVMRDALAIANTGTAGFGVTIDLDALDPDETPAVGSPVAGGIRQAALLEALTQLGAHPALLAMELVEYNPVHDKLDGAQPFITDVIDTLISGRPVASTLQVLEYRYGAHHYEPKPVVLVRGSGVYVWDRDGRRYLDMMSAYSAVSHGHCHPRLLHALNQQAGTLAVTSRAYYNDCLPLFLQRLCEVTGLDLALPANTGLEAVEAALKVARKWAYEVKRVPENQAEIIACEGNFHGRSIAIVAMSSEEQYRAGFGPLPSGFLRVPYGDAAALERAITPNTAAFLVEPVQGEAGIIVPPAGYLAQCAAICRRHNVLLLCDEVQTGLGRTGRMLACQHEDVLPDGVILGKALGGGLLPVSAFVARRAVMAVLKPGDHGSTFGGTPLAAAVGLEALAVLIDEQLPQRAAELGAYLLAQLRAIDSPLIAEVRGKGLLIGLEVNTALVSANTVCERLIAQGVLSKDTHGTVLRFAPPLVITKAQLDDVLMRLRFVFSALENELGINMPLVSAGQ